MNKKIVLTDDHLDTARHLIPAASVFVLCFRNPFDWYLAVMYGIAVIVFTLLTNFIPGPWGRALVVFLLLLFTAWGMLNIYDHVQINTTVLLY